MLHKMQRNTESCLSLLSRWHSDLVLEASNSVGNSSQVFFFFFFSVWYIHSKSALMQQTLNLEYLQVVFFFPVCLMN